MSALNVGSMSLLAPAPTAVDVRSMLVESVKAVRTRQQQQKRVLAYVTGSLAVHLGMWAVMSAMPVEDSNINLSLSSTELTSTSSSSTAMDETPAQVEQGDDGTETTEPGAGAVAMTLTSGEAGNPNAKDGGSMKIQKTHTDPAIARQQAIEYARSAGVMGNVRSLSTAINSLAGNQDWTSGYDTASIYGPLVGGDGEGRGKFGMGRDGDGAGGGCYGQDCGSVPGSGRYHTIPGPGGGDGPWGPGKGWGREPVRKPGVPAGPDIGTPEAAGGLDPKTIRRYVKMNTFKISYCYEHELLGRADLQGDIMVNFLITGSGTVQVSTGKGFDGAVASCVASVIKNIQFPAPKNGGNVQVNYPFSFRRAGR